MAYEYLNEKIKRKQYETYSKMKLNLDILYHLQCFSRVFSNIPHEYLAQGVRDAISGGPNLL